MDCKNLLVPGCPDVRKMRQVVGLLTRQDKEGKTSVRDETSPRFAYKMLSAALVPVPGHSHPGTEDFASMLSDLRQRFDQLAERPLPPTFGEADEPEEGMSDREYIEEQAKHILELASALEKLWPLLLRRAGAQLAKLASVALGVRGTSSAAFSKAGSYRESKAEPDI